MSMRVIFARGLEGKIPCILLVQLPMVDPAVKEEKEFLVVSLCGGR